MVKLTLFFERNGLLKNIFAKSRKQKGPLDFSKGPFIFFGSRLFSKNVAGNKNTLAITFTSFTLNTAYHKYQFPSVGNHIIDH